LRCHSVYSKNIEYKKRTYNHYFFLHKNIFYKIPLILFSNKNRTNQLMKRITKYFIILTISLFSFSSCEFSPSEIPLTEVEKPSDNAPSIEIELTPEMATLRLSEPVWITYSVQSGDREIYRINVELDDTELSDVRYNSSQEIRAYVPVNLIEDGIHELKITTYTSTNSGSIADKIGSEAYLYEIKWPVFVNKQAKENFVFYDPEFVPEGIKVSWPQYSYADFDYYGFSRNPSGIQSKKITITDPYQNSYIDSTYIEGF
jgi:hypothetical protein